MTHRSPIALTSYSDHWPDEFEAERRVLASVLGNEGVCIEHIGSTAVPGLSAKPIIDVMLGASSLQIIESWVSILEGLGYEYMSIHETEIPDRRFFAKPRMRPRHIHLHAVVLGGKFWMEHLAFRDALRSDPLLASSYETLKLSLSEQFGDDRESYTRAKGAFIVAVVKNTLG